VGCCNRLSIVADLKAWSGVLHALNQLDVLENLTFAQVTCADARRSYRTSIVCWHHMPRHSRSCNHCPDGRFHVETDDPE
jgi:hypothetical protein